MYVTSILIKYSHSHSVTLLLIPQRICQILLQTLVAILGVVSRKSPFRSMLSSSLIGEPSSSLIGELRASFVVPINEYCLLVIYAFALSLLL